jgi:hypothetical protein
VLHAARNVQDLVGGPVNVYVTAPDADLAAEAPLGSFNFKETLPADAPAELTAGDYQIRVGVGTPGDPEFLLAFDSGTVTLSILRSASWCSTALAPAKSSAAARQLRCASCMRRTIRPRSTYSRTAPR